MAEKKQQSVFQTLQSVDYSEYVEQKGNLKYLSWANAWKLVKNLYPDATFKVYETEGGLNYFTDGKTAWVKVGVTVDGQEMVEMRPVYDHRNQSIPLERLTSGDVNTSIKRALVKACALHGLAIALYAGDDLDYISPVKYLESVTAEAFATQMKEAKTMDELKTVWTEVQRKQRSLTKEELDSLDKLKNQKKGELDAQQPAKN